MAMGMVLMLVADEAGHDVSHVEAKRLLQLAEWDSTLQQDTGVPIGHNIGVSVRGAGKRVKYHIGQLSFFTVDSDCGAVTGSPLS